MAQKECRNRLFQCWKARGFLTGVRAILIFQRFSNIREYSVQPVLDEINESLQQLENKIQDDHKHVIEELAHEGGFYANLQAKNLGNEALLSLWGFNRKDILASAEQISGKNYGQQPVKLDSNFLILIKHCRIIIL